MKSMRSHRQRGFTLIEVIIAFALLALALTLLLGSLSGAARQIRTADDSGRATLHAQSLLAQLGVGEILQPGRKQGTFEQGRYRWTLEMEPYVDPLKRRSPQTVASAPRLLRVQLEVEWGDAPGQRLRWQTLRLAAGRRHEIPLMKSMRSHRQRGFTLIEVIIAFALLALALTLLLGSLSGAARQIRTADDSGRATLHAQSLLAQLGVGEILQPGRKEGTFEAGRYRWTLEMTPYVDPLKRRSPQAVSSAPRLLQVQLQVEWGDAPGQRLRWQTLRLAPADINVSAPVP